MCAFTGIYIYWCMCICIFALYVCITYRPLFHISFMGRQNTNKTCDNHSVWMCMHMYLQMFTLCFTFKLYQCVGSHICPPRMMTSSNRFSALLALCAGNSLVPGEFPAQRPLTRSFDVFFDLRPNKRLSKQSWGWWFETTSRSSWRHCNELSESRYHVKHKLCLLMLLDLL